MKKLLLILFIVFITDSFGRVSENFNHRAIQENCLNIANATYDAMFDVGGYRMASRAADEAYDNCVEQGGYAGDSVVTIEVSE